MTRVLSIQTTKHIQTMNGKLRSLCVGVLTVSIALAGFADTVIEGKVTLPPQKINTAALARYKLKSGQVNLPEPPAAVVFLDGTFEGSNSPATLEVVQKGYQFFPGVIPVLKGSAIEFPNHDDDYHHVFSYSKTKEFDLGRYRKDEKPPPIVFPNAGVVKVGCEIHDHMRTIVLVLDTPHFTKTDTNGIYRLVLKGIPDGKYTLKAWVNERTTYQREIEVKGDSSITANFP